MLEIKRPRRGKTGGSRRLYLYSVGQAISSRDEAGGHGDYLLLRQTRPSGGIERELARASAARDERSQPMGPGLAVEAWAMRENRRSLAS
jgi:hypothetical protein